MLSPFDVGYLLMQAVGEFLADWFGGKIVLGLEGLRWSFFTIVTPRAELFGMLIAQDFMSWDRQSLCQTLISPDFKMVPQQ